MAPPIILQGVGVGKPGLADGQLKCVAVLQAKIALPGFIENPETQFYYRPFRHRAPQLGAQRIARQKAVAPDNARISRAAVVGHAVVVSI